MALIQSFDGEFRFLSNFWPAKVVFEGIEFPTTEHAYQAAKTFDIEKRKEIANLDTPGKAKRAGSKVVIRPDWEEVKVNIMMGLLRQKFMNPKLREELLKTGDDKLVEGNTWHDRFWGVCVCAKCMGRGSNYLGSLLMLVRKEIKDSLDKQN